MAVMTLAAVVVVSSTTTAIGHTGAARAGVQSAAAAESGNNVAEVALRQNTCQATYTKVSAPAFTAKVFYSLSPSNNIWVSGCPAAGINAQRLKVVSTGTALSKGVVGNVSGDETAVETIYAMVRLPGVYPSGSAMYMHGGVVFKNNADILVAVGGVAAIQVKAGNVTCANNTVIQGDVIVSNGSLFINSCTIKGNVWVSGAATLGDVVGNLTAASVNNASRVTGVYTQSGTVPTVPDWVDLNYVPGDWVDTAGVPYKVTPMDATCTLTAALLATASNGGKPVIINALNMCPGGVKAPSNVALTSDLVVFGSRFDFLSTVAFASSNTTKRKLWFITPDATPDRQPTCAGQGDFSLKNNFTLDPTVVAMLYTPCKMDAQNNFLWRGQIYANGANDFWNNTDFYFEALGIPNVDLANGLQPTGGAIGSDAKLGDLLSLRDVKD